MACTQCRTLGDTCPSGGWGRRGGSVACMSLVGDGGRSQPCIQWGGRSVTLVPSGEWLR